MSCLGLPQVQQIKVLVMFAFEINRTKRLLINILFTCVTFVPHASFAYSCKGMYCLIFIFLFVPMLPPKVRKMIVWKVFLIFDSDWMVIHQTRQVNTNKHFNFNHWKCKASKERDHIFFYKFLQASL